jgi:RNA recognition motif-containing protein
MGPKQNSLTSILYQKKVLKAPEKEESLVKLSSLVDSVKRTKLKVSKRTTESPKFSIKKQKQLSEFVGIVNQLQHGETSKPRERITIRITNLSSDLTKSDLQVLLRQFGGIEHVSVQQDLNKQLNNGIVTVSFSRIEDGLHAIQVLNGTVVDGTTLHCFQVETSPQIAPADPVQGGKGIARLLRDGGLKFKVFEQ